MKKRIISLMLVIVLAVLSLASCAYSYERDNMSNYVNFDVDGFLAKLEEGLSIKDESFTSVKETRDERVLDAIFTTLVGKADKTEKVTEGTPSKYDTYHYCFYCTFENDKGETVYIYTSSMKESTASNTKVQLGMSTLDGLDLEIANKVKDLDITGKAYSTDSTSKVIAGNTVVVSYTKNVPTADGGLEETVYEYQIIEIPETTPENDADKTFADKLVGLTAGASKGSDIEVTEDGKKVTYAGTKVNWIIKTGKEAAFTVKYTPYTDDNTDKDKVEVSTIHGSKDKVDIKNKELTYHIFPVYYIEVVSELTAEVIVDTILGNKLWTDSDSDKKVDEGEKGVLDVFTDDDYKNGEDSISAIIEKLYELQLELDDAKKELEEAEEELDELESDKAAAGSTSNPDLDKKLEDAKKAKKDAEDAKAAAETAVDEQLKKLFGCTSTGEGDKAVEEAIIEQYKKQQYDSLEAEYKEKIKQSLAKELYALAKEFMTFEKNGDVEVLPESAVNETYDRVINNYKYNFYEGTYDTTTKESNYHYYVTEGHGGFEGYLMKQLSVDSADKAYAKIKENARASVKEIVCIFAFKAATGDTDVTPTEEQRDNALTTYYYNMYFTAGSANVDDIKENDYLPALQIDNILNYFLEEVEKKEGDESLKVEYKHVPYSFTE